MKVLGVATRTACWRYIRNKSWKGGRSHDWWVGLVMQNLMMCMEVCILSVMKNHQMVVRQKTMQLIDSCGNFLWILSGKALCWHMNFQSGVFMSFCFLRQDLAMQPSLVLNTLSSCLCLPRACIICVLYNVWLMLTLPLGTFSLPEVESIGNAFLYIALDGC